MILQIAPFIILGGIGGFSAVLMLAEKWEDLTTFAAFKRYVIGGIVGGLYYALYAQHNFPNFVMAFVSGYCGTDFINKLVERVKKKDEQK